MIHHHHAHNLLNIPIIESTDENILWLSAEKHVYQFFIQLNCRKSLCEDELVGQGLFDIREMEATSAIVNLRNSKNTLNGISIVVDAKTESEEDVLRQFVFLNQNRMCIKLRIIRIDCDADIARSLSNVYISVYPSHDGKVGLVRPNSNEFPTVDSAQIPFSFTLPHDLPSSAVFGDYKHVHYSIHSVWEGRGAEERQPSGSITGRGHPLQRVSDRAYFYVIQPLASATYMRPQTVRVNIPYHIPLVEQQLLRMLRISRKEEDKEVRRLQQVLPEKGFVRVDCQLNRSGEFIVFNFRQVNLTHLPLLYTLPGFAPGESLRLSFRTALVKRESDKNSYDRLSTSTEAEGRAGLLVGQLSYCILQEISYRKESGGCGCGIVCWSRKRSDGAELQENNRVVVLARTEVALPPGDIVSFPLPPLPPTFEGIQEAASVSSSSANPDPLHWRYLLQVNLQLHPTEKGDRVGLRLRGRQQVIFRFPIVVCALGLSRIPAPLALSKEEKIYEGIEMKEYDEEKNSSDLSWTNPELHPPLSCCAMVPWQTILIDEAYAAVYATLTRSGLSATSKEVRRDAGETLCRDTDEDFGCRDRDSLILRPCYLLSEPGKK